MNDKESFIEEINLTSTTSNNAKDDEIQHISAWGALQKYSAKLDSFGVETTGIERIPPSQRPGNISLRKRCGQFATVFGLWGSAAGGVSSMSSFFLGSTLFELTFKQSLLCSLVGQFIGCAAAAYCSTMGPQSGCRQMVTARYLFGWWFVKFVALLACVIAGLGWSVVNSVLAGQMLHAVSDGKVPNWVGILIISIFALLVSTVGIKWVLRVEKYYAIAVFIATMLLYICTSDKYEYLYKIDNSSVAQNEMTGDWLSFFSIAYSASATWGSITADYYIMFSEDTPKWQVFTVTFLGIGLPTTWVACAGMVLGALCMTEDGFIAAYADDGFGGAVLQAFSRWNGFGKFLVIVFLLSLIASTIINTYSAAFAFQLTGVWFAKVPRWTWSIVFTIIYFVLAMAGKDHFSTILSNFLPMIGYWISMYIVLLLEEDLFFRRFFLHLYTKEFPPNEGNLDDDEEEEEEKPIKSRYNWEAWNDITVLTHGYASMFGFACGVAGAVVGMAQVYWIGPLAAYFGPYGGDLGMWLTMGFAAIAFPPARYLELKYFGR